MSVAETSIRSNHSVPGLDRVKIGFRLNNSWVPPQYCRGGDSGRARQCEMQNCRVLLQMNAIPGFTSTDRDDRCAND